MGVSMISLSDTSNDHPKGTPQDFFIEKNTKHSSLASIVPLRQTRSIDTMRVPNLKGLVTCMAAEEWGLALSFNSTSFNWDPPSTSISHSSPWFPFNPQQQVCHMSFGFGPPNLCDLFFHGARFFFVNSRKKRPGSQPTARRCRCSRRSRSWPQAQVGRAVVCRRCCGWPRTGGRLRGFVDFAGGLSLFLVCWGGWGIVELFQIFVDGVIQIY